MPGTRKLGRSTDHRRAMMRAMVTYLLENGKIETTVTRAKEVRAMAEKMITLGKVDTLHAKRQVYSYVTKEAVAKKVFKYLIPAPRIPSSKQFTTPIGAKITIIIRVNALDIAAK